MASAADHDGADASFCREFESCDGDAGDQRDGGCQRTQRCCRMMVAKGRSV